MGNLLSDYFTGNEPPRPPPVVHRERNDFPDYNIYTTAVPEMQSVARHRTPATEYSYRRDMRVSKEQSVKLYRSIIEQCMMLGWTSMSLEREVTFVSLGGEGREYINIQHLFYKTTKRKQHRVVRILRVENPFVKGRYLLKKLEMQQRYGYVEERLLFHGTRDRNVKDICTDNFNWRISGTALGHRYGEGISFTPISYYASHYCDKKTSRKVMLVSKVLIAEVCLGGNNMKLPDYLDINYKLRYDTSEKEDGSVLVKYYDDEFYPAYVIYFVNILPIDIR